MRRIMIMLLLVLSSACWQTAVLYSQEKTSQTNTNCIKENEKNNSNNFQPNINILRADYFLSAC
jgi:uncharacterized membrane protein